MMYKYSLFLLVWVTSKQAQQLPPAFASARNQTAQSDPTVRTYVSPTTILWRNENTSANVRNAARLLAPVTDTLIYLIKIFAY